MRKIYGIARTAKKGTGVYLRDVDGKLMFPHGSCRDLKAGPVEIKHVINKGNYMQFFAKPYKMTLPCEADLVNYLSRNIQFGNIIEMNDEEYGHFYIAPNGDTLTKDERGRLCIIGKASRLERKSTVLNKIDISTFLMEKKFKCSCAELASKFDVRFKKECPSDENVDFSHLSEVK